MARQEIRSLDFEDTKATMSESEYIVFVIVMTVSQISLVILMCQSYRSKLLKFAMVLKAQAVFTVFLYRIDPHLENLFHFTLVSLQMIVGLGIYLQI